MHHEITIFSAIKIYLLSLVLAIPCILILLLLKSPNLLLITASTVVGQILAIVYSNREYNFVLRDVLSFSVRAKDSIVVGIFSIGIAVVLQKITLILHLEVNATMKGSIKDTESAVALIIGALIILFITPIMEEIIFRGIFTLGFYEAYGTVIAIIVSSLAFSLVHGSPSQMFTAFFSALFFSWITIRTRNILYSIIGHMIFNLSTIFHNTIDESLPVNIFGIVMLVVGAILIRQNKSLNPPASTE